LPQSHRSPQLHFSPQPHDSAHLQTASFFSEQQLFFFWVFIVFLLSQLLTQDLQNPYTEF
jgi:hypothetical protein